MADEHEETFNQMLIRYDCRVNYNLTASFEHNNMYSEDQQAIWDDEMQQIMNDEAKSV